MVLTAEDIARTRSPRIVKLHGTLPSHTPFIFAEEDYRTYPTKFAPFVNLAQHILLENELLLLGFSGDDPNFLAWAGWARDQLGSSARRIRLAGVLDLTPARRRYLENLNVTPIDLAPLVKDIVDPKQRHEQAISLLLESLHRAKPKPNYTWSRSEAISRENWKVKTPENRITELVEKWSSDRKSAPAWLVAPFYERIRLRSEAHHVANLAICDLEQIGPRLRGRFAAELSWLLQICHAGVEDWAKKPLKWALDNDTDFLLVEDQLRILILLCYQSIEDRDEQSYAQYIEGLDNIREQHAEASAWLAYLRAIHARDNLDLEGIASVILEIKGNDPVWSFRRAALYCVLCEPNIAAELIRDTLKDIRKRRSLDRRSLWLLSREAWAAFLWRSMAFELRLDRQEDELLQEWPLVFAENKLDPWEEFNALDREISREQDNATKYSRREKVHFEAGSWTPAAAKTEYGVSTWSISAEMQIRRFADAIGVPYRAGSSNILESRLGRAVSAFYSNLDAAGIWRIVSYIHSHEDGFINEWFSRVQVAALPTSLVTQLVASLQQTIQYFLKKMQSDDNNQITRIQQLRALTQLLSRLAVRVPQEEAAKLFDLSLTIFDHHGCDHWWLLKPIGDLAARSLSAIPPSDRATYIGAMLNFPLPAEHSIGGIERDWPEFSDLLRIKSLKIHRSPGEWDKRISELIEWCTKDELDSRHHSILRLWLLFEKNVLTKNEKNSFAQALWSQRSSPSGLPKDNSLYPGVFLSLPEPSKGMAVAAFKFDVMEPLFSGKIDPKNLHSLAFAGTQNELGFAPQTLSSDEACRLIAKILAQPDESFYASSSDAICFGLLPFADLNEEIASKLWDCTLRSDARGSLRFLPYLVRFKPAYIDKAIVRIIRAINARDFETVDNGLNAIRTWFSFKDEVVFPESLSAAVASLIAMRREPGLFRAIEITAVFVEHKLLSKNSLDNIYDGLTELLIETDYQNWRHGDFRTATLTYVRAGAYRLAQALHQKGEVDPIIGHWITASANDPVPEVRWVTEND